MSKMLAGLKTRNTYIQNVQCKSITVVLADWFFQTKSISFGKEGYNDTPSIVE